MMASGDGADKNPQKRRLKYERMMAVCLAHFVARRDWIKRKMLKIYGSQETVYIYPTGTQSETPTLQ